MVLQSLGPISLYNIKNEFNGVMPIKLSDYYKNAISGYTNSITLFPNSNSPISFNMFYGKSTDTIAIINDNSIISYIKTPISYTFTNTNATIQFNQNKYCEVLMVGGGGGGYDGGAGKRLGAGGGGYVLYRSNYLFLAGNIYNIVIGNGGSGGNAGGETYIKTFTKILSAKGGNIGTADNNQFSYGGSSGNDIDGVVNTYSGGSGSFYVPYLYYAGGAGAAGNTTNSINGGIGFKSSITGIETFYGSGGAGFIKNIDDYWNAPNHANGTFSGGTYGVGGFPVIGGNYTGSKGCVIIKIKE